MQQLKLAICGGGIASLCLAHALLVQHPQWGIHVFEASPEPRDESAAIGIGHNSQTALSMISPQMGKALEAAKGVKMEPSCRLMMGTGPNAGCHIGDINHPSAQVVVHRGMLSQTLLSLIPIGVVTFGKKLVSVKNRSEASVNLVELYFEDGTKFEADALVGCDGINSVTRKAVLGADHPAATPIFTNRYSHRIVVPIEKARKAFGEEYCSLQTQYGWIGDQGFLLTDHMNDGKEMQVIAGFQLAEGDWPYSETWVEWPIERTERDLAGWGEVGKAMTKIFKAEPKLYAARYRTHLDTPTYYNSAVCLAGDAAQVISPAQGAGAGQAIEDALMLSTVLGTCNSRDEIPKAFQTYDALRRPRRKGIAESSAKRGLLLTGKAPGIGLDMKRLAAELPTWSTGITDYDLVAAQAEALRMMKQES